MNEKVRELSRLFANAARVPESNLFTRTSINELFKQSVQKTLKASSNSRDRKIYDLFRRFTEGEKQVLKSGKFNQTVEDGSTGDDEPPLASTLRYFPEMNTDRRTLTVAVSPFNRLQTDLADMRFLKPAASQPKYALIFVDVYTEYRQKYYDNVWVP